MKSLAQILFWSFEQRFHWVERLRLKFGNGTIIDGPPCSTRWIGIKRVFTGHLLLQMTMFRTTKQQWMHTYIKVHMYVFYILILKACKLHAHDGVKYFLEYSAHHILIVSLAFMELKSIYIIQKKISIRRQKIWMQNKITESELEFSSKITILLVW